ncbi:MAG: hypothetical protein WCK98_05600 [bacterium]
MSQKKSVSKLNFIKLNNQEQESEDIDFELDETEAEVSHVQGKKFADREHHHSKNDEKTIFDSVGLSNIFKRNNHKSLTDVQDEAGSEVLALETTQPNPNSIGSIFRKDRNEITGVNRVFKKSMSLLSVFLFSFLALIIISLNWFSTSIIVSLALFVFFVAISNIFYIIVADRSYVWLSLLGEFLLIIIASSFTGQGFTAITLLSGLLIILFTYLAYTELEKVQLSSRLFSISQITQESTRILMTSATIVIALGVFNGIISEGVVNGKNEGSGPFINHVVLKSKFIMENVIIGKNKTLSINRYLMDGKLYRESGGDKIFYDVSTKTGTTSKQATFAIFLENNYKNPTLISEKESEDFKATNCSGDVNSPACDQLLQDEKNKRLKEWKDEAYGNIPLTLDTKLDKNSFALVSQQFYLNRINDFENAKGGDNNLVPESLLIVPLKTLIPAMIAIGVFVILYLFRFLFAWFILFTTWIIWKILNIFGFVQIDVETVEAEIVSI